MTRTRRLASLEPCAPKAPWLVETDHPTDMAQRIAHSKGAGIFPASLSDDNLQLDCATKERATHAEP